MKISQTEELDDGHRLRVTVHVGPKEKNRLIDECLDEFCQRFQLEKDKNPDLRQSLIDGIGEDNVNKMVASSLAQKLAPFAINKLNLRTMFNPDIAYDVEFDVLVEGECNVPIDFILMPEYELTSYDPLTVTVPALSVSEQQVDDQIAQQLDQFAEYVPTSGTSLDENDCATVDMRVTQDGEDLEGLCGNEQIIHLERGLMPDGFIDGIIGMKVGETKEFDFEGPSGEAGDENNMEPYHVELTIKDKRKRVIPSLTNEFVRKHFGAFEGTAAEYRKNVKAKLQARLDDYSKNQRDALADETLGKRLKAQVPDVYYDYAQAEILKNLQQQLEIEHMTLEGYMEKRGMDEDAFNMMLIMEAANSLRSTFALDAIFRHRDMQVTQAEIDAALRQVAGPDAEEEMRKEFDRNGTWFIAQRIAERTKAHSWVMDTANFVSE